jgi:hypothetical protein
MDAVAAAWSVFQADGIICFENATKQKLRAVEPMQSDRNLL